jgi:hypothetical protein
MIINPEIERYMESLLPPRDAVVAEMEAAAARRNIPIVGPSRRARAGATGDDLRARSASSSWARLSAIRPSGWRALRSLRPKFTTPMAAPPTPAKPAAISSALEWRPLSRSTWVMH